MKLLLFTAVFIVTASAAPTPQCSASLAQSGVSSRYSETVAHAIHSITLNELRMFNPITSTENNVPTVNRAIAGSPHKQVVQHAPEVSTVVPIAIVNCLQVVITQDFATEAMNLFDETLTHAQDRSDGLGDNWNPLVSLSFCLPLHRLSTLEYSSTFTMLVCAQYDSCAI
jgi:hypothetical protein